MIKAIAFTAYPSDNVAATRAWYEHVLGLTFAGPYVEDGIEKYNEAHLGDGCFSLMASEWVGRAPGSAAGIEVDDVEGAIRSVRDKGVLVDDFFDGPVCRQASFADPEGNSIRLHQRKLPA
jgi:predicted enzyme related to lactoylglutathione lyase